MAVSGAVPAAAPSQSTGTEGVQGFDDQSAGATAAAPAPSARADRALRSHEALSSMSGQAASTIALAAAPEQAAIAQGTHGLASMYQQPESAHMMQPELADYGAYAPGPALEPSALDGGMLSPEYKAGYHAGYEAAVKALTGHLRQAQASSVASSPQPSTPSSEAPIARSNPFLKPTHSDELSAHSQQGKAFPQGYGHYGGAQSALAGRYGSKSPAPMGETKQGTHSAAAYAREAASAQIRYSYGSQAPAYAYQMYAYQSSADSLQATAHEQASRFQGTRFTTSTEHSSEAPGPGELQVYAVCRAIRCDDTLK